MLFILFIFINYIRLSLDLNFKAAYNEPYCRIYWGEILVEKVFSKN